MALKFGSPAWRKKYVTNGKKKKKTKRKVVYKDAAYKVYRTVKRKKNRPNTYTKKGAAAKRKRLKEMIRSNPPRNWTKVKAVRVIRKGGRDVLQIKK